MMIAMDQSPGLSKPPNAHRQVPDVQLQCPAGGTVSPADLVGHGLVVLFAPADGIAASGELEEYARRLAELDEVDAWLLAVSDQQALARLHGVSIVRDIGGRAWRAMVECAPGESLSRDQGAAFIFGRGGTLQKVFGGAGRIDEVIEELRSRR